MSVTVEDFLEHHGVKGQHWGIRNVKQEAHNLKTKFNKNKKLKTGLKIAGGVAAVAAVATGAIIADRLIRQHSAVKATDLRTLWSKATPGIIGSPAMKTPVSALSKGAFNKEDLNLIRPKGLKEIERRANATLKPGAKTSVSDVGKSISNVAKSVNAQDVRNATTRAAVLKSLRSIRISVG